MSISEEERKDILNQLAEGKITAAVAAELLGGPEIPEKEDAKKTVLGSTQSIEITKEELYDEQDRPPSKERHWFHIRVNDLKSGKNRVTVNIPLKLITMGLNIGQRFAPEMDGLDWGEINSALHEHDGVLIDVTDESDREHVLIYVD